MTLPQVTVTTPGLDHHKQLARNRYRERSNPLSALQMVSIRDVWKQFKTKLRRRRHNETQTTAIYTESAQHTGPPLAQGSFILRMPPEMLSEILIRCHPLPGFWDNAANPVHNIPIYLTQICSSWRQIAVNTPELWSSVTLCFAKRSGKSTRAIIEFVTPWLAKGLPGKLELRIDMGSILDFGNNRIDNEAIGRFIAAHASDWQKLCVSRSQDDTTRKIIACLEENSFPSLEEIDLQALDPIWKAPFDTLMHLPRLRGVRLRLLLSFHQPLPLKLLFLPWSRITSLCLTPTSGQECLAFLSDCPELVTLELDTCIFADIVIDGSQTSKITVPKLSQLRLSVVLTEGGSRIESFLRVLYLPSLRDLDLSVTRSDPWNPLSSEFWRIYAAQLNRLTLSSLSLSLPDDLHLLFRTMPNLVSLSFAPRGLTALDFDVLRSENLLPNLTHLEAVLGSIPGVPPLESVRAAVALLEARSAAVKDASVARLEHVEFVDYTDQQPAWFTAGINQRPGMDLLELDMELQRLRELKAQGMYIQWHTRIYRYSTFTAQLPPL
ncbi:hypothetical protein B0H11DRAFT_2268667 [Mycena galericulata]|nr:hypothetical protein B0H11DRAFT_2268667 [Mycena galericulata]